MNTTTTHPPTYVPQLGDRVALTVHTLHQSKDVVGEVTAVAYSIKRRRPFRIIVETAEYGTLAPELHKLTPVGPRCVCALHTDGSVTTYLCPLHADTDPCLTESLCTGRRRVGSIRRGTCSACGWGGAR